MGTKYLLPLLAAVLLLAAYYYIDPMTIWTPKCLFKQLTGYSCPACGAQRALHAVAHLHFGEAVRHNLFLLVGVPYLLSVVVCDIAGYKHFPRITRIVKSKAAAYLYVGLFFAWWIVRNIFEL